MGKMLIAMLCGVFGGIWRRGFGCDFWGLPVLKIRAVQHGLAALGLFALFYGYRDMSIWTSVYGIGVIQGLFWAGGHGAAFDMSRSGQPDENIVKRYNKVWFAPIVNFLVPQSMWYGFGYDFLWMAIRYTWPLALLVPVFGLGVLWLGPVVALIYAVCWSWYEKGVSGTKESNLKKYPLPFNLQPTQLAEIIAGALSGFMWGML